MKTYVGRGKAPLILNPGTNGGERLTSRSGCFTPGKEPLCSLYRPLGGPQSCCGRFGGEKVRTPDHRAFCTDYAVPASSELCSVARNEGVVKMNRKRRVMRPAKGSQEDPLMLCLDIPDKSNVLG